MYYWHILLHWNTSISDFFTNFFKNRLFCSNSARLWVWKVFRRSLGTLKANTKEFWPKVSLISTFLAVNVVRTSVSLEKVKTWIFREKSRTHEPSRHSEPSAKFGIPWTKTFWHTSTSSFLKILQKKSKLLFFCDKIYWDLMHDDCGHRRFRRLQKNQKHSRCPWKFQEM